MSQAPQGLDMLIRTPVSTSDADEALSDLSLRLFAVLVTAQASDGAAAVLRLLAHNRWPPAAVEQSAGELHDAGRITQYGRSVVLALVEA